MYWYPLRTPNILILPSLPLSCNDVFVLAGSANVHNSICGPCAMTCVCMLSLIVRSDLGLADRDTVEPLYKGQILVFWDKLYNVITICRRICFLKGIVIFYVGLIFWLQHSFRTPFQWAHFFREEDGRSSDLHRLLSPDSGGGGGRILFKFMYG